MPNVFFLGKVCQGLGFILVSVIHIVLLLIVTECEVQSCSQVCGCPRLKGNPSDKERPILRYVTNYDFYIWRNIVIDLS